MHKVSYWAWPGRTFAAEVAQRRRTPMTTVQLAAFHTPPILQSFDRDQVAGPRNTPEAYHYTA